MNTIINCTTPADPSTYHDPALLLQHQAQKLRWMGIAAEAAQAERHLKDIAAPISTALIRPLGSSIDTLPEIGQN